MQSLHLTQWNTYGDPPNSDLLRRYGHVDVVPLCVPLTGEGNPEDVVEVRADLVVSAASNASSEHLQERIDWWLENTDDEQVAAHLSHPMADGKDLVPSSLAPTVNFLRI